MMHTLSTAFFASILIGCIWFVGKTIAQAKDDYKKMMDDLDRLGRDDD